MPIARRPTTRALAILLSLAAVLAALLLAPGAATAAAPTTTPSTGQSQVEWTQDIRYGPAKNLILDVFRLPTAADDPVVILIHGGGWSEGDKDRFEDESRTLAREGFVVFDINYTLVPNSGAAYPSQVQDVHLALRWVLDHAAEYGGDPDRLGVLGGSAGGYLASILAFQADTATEQPVRALVSLSGPLDLPGVAEVLRASTPSPDGTCVPATCERLRYVSMALRTLLGCLPENCPDDLLAEASPTTYVSDYSPPSFFANSTLEMVVPEQSVRVAELLEEHGVPVETRVIDGDYHSVKMLPFIGADVLAFLQTNLAPREPTPTATATTSAPTAAPVVASDTDRSPWRNARWWVIGAILLLLALAIVVRRRRPPAAGGGSPL